MRAMLLGLAAPLAALAFPAAPAQAQMPADRVAAAPGASVQGHVDHDDGDGNDDHGRHHRRHRDGVVVLGGPWGAPEAWALYNNRSWEPESFNDWWHERPWRAYPRWMQSNQNCQRLWWSGGGWRC